ncbi:MAG: hypothetical protein LBL25_01250 [Oscillospiraceae bacterium]|jgi:hypothetical protein|nr:hypothetical protein [Oscillospiraceae bacterium]
MDKVKTGKIILRRAAALALTVALLAAAAVFAPAASAVKFGDVSGVPKDFWSVYVPYEQAVANNDAAGIAANGDKVISYWLSGAAAEKRAAEWASDVEGHGYEINTVWVVANEAAERYETLGDTANAVRVYKIALAFADAYKALTPKIGGDPDDMEFARTKLQNKISAYDVQISVYAELRDGSGDTSHHGAVNEPKTGVYFGEPAGGGAVMDSSKRPSGTLIYVDFEDENIEARVENDLKANESQHGYARGDYAAVEIAWNFKNEGASLADVPRQETKVSEAARYLKSLGIPVLLRVGAEMNAWPKAASPDEYKAAFRFIADIMHRQAPNVALLWSVNAVSSQGLTYDMFYPGDQYVDWVGISLYTTKYFLGNPDTDESTASIYGTGKYANPVGVIRDLVEQYGSRKPIAVSEGGVSLLCNKNGEDLTSWALPRIRQVYAYIPILFPQVKAMFWFNVRRDGEPNRYDFAASPAAKTLYGQMTGSDYFIAKGGTQASVTYKKLGTAELPAGGAALLTYAPYFTVDGVSVQYLVDGAQVAQSSDIPYRQSLDLSGLSNGAHKLTVRAAAGGKLLGSAEYNMQKSGSSVTVSAGAIAAPATVTAKPNASTVLVNGKSVAFDAYTINETNYFKLRDLAYTLNGTAKQFDLGWDGANNAINLLSGKPYTPDGSEMSGKGVGDKAAAPTSSKIFLDGTEVRLAAYTIGESNYFKLKDVGQAFDFSLTWDGANNTIIIDTSRGY